MGSRSVDVVVIGAGPAGLATSRELGRRRVEHIVLERGDRIGHTWSNLYDSLVLHTGKHLSVLPGMAFPASTPLFPTRRDFLEYLERYAETFRVPVQTASPVNRIDRETDSWRVRSADGRDISARAVVLATGIVANPYLPPVPGRNRYTGRFIHSVEYRRPEPYTSRRVLVVGVGNSAGEIAAELAATGAIVTIAVRSGARVVPRELLGVPIQYFANALSVLPRSVQRSLSTAIARVSEAVRGSVLPRLEGERCSDIPVIGFHLVDALRAGRIRMRPGLAEFTAAGVRFTDGTEEPFDDVIMATGYRPAMDVLNGRVTRDDCGFARRSDRVRSSDYADLFFVGHNYDTRGALRNIAQDARLAAAAVARQAHASTQAR